MLPVRAVADRMRLYVAVLLAAAAAQAPAASAAAISPAVQVDLSPLGQGIMPGELLPLLQFTGNSTLAVAFVVQNPRTESPKLLRRGEVAEQPRFLLQAALIDADTGAVLKRAKWPTNRLRHSGLVTALGSEVVVLLGDRVALFDDNLELIKQLQLPHGSEWGWRAYASPSGRNILFVSVSRRKQERSAWLWVDASRLQVVREWSKSPFESLDVSISDSQIFFVDCSRGLHDARACELLAQPLQSDSPRRVAIVDWSSVGNLNPRFVAENLLFLATDYGISIYDLRGSGAIFQSPADRLGPVVFAVAAPAQQADRFVVPVLHPEGAALKLESLDIFDGPHPAHPREVGMRRGPSLFWLRWLTPGLWPFWFALSPDGKLLAVMQSFKTLLIFSLPPPDER
ncbi:MAG TPA: hypothetical protein VGW37_16370 [Terriglobia bacterium]|nr:hypothetical protein [Terriglobia bacterium]